jgi:predicted nucleotidyltransferase
MMPFGLREQVWERIRTVLAGHPSVERAVLYGSRAKGCHRPGSDIDLNLQGKEITPKERNRILLELDDLDLPWVLDVTVLHEITHEPFQEHIKRVGVEIYSRDADRPEMGVDGGC